MMEIGIVHIIDHNQKKAALKLLETKRFIKVNDIGYSKGEFVQVAILDKSVVNHSRFSDYSIVHGTVKEVRNTQYVVELANDPAKRVIPKTMIDAPKSHTFALNSQISLFKTSEGKIFLGKPFSPELEHSPPLQNSPAENSVARSHNLVNEPVEESTQCTACNQRTLRKDLLEAACGCDLCRICTNISKAMNNICNNCGNFILGNRPKCHNCGTQTKDSFIENLRCEHSFCANCLKKQIEVYIHEYQRPPVCPDCNELIESIVVHKFVDDKCLNPDCECKYIQKCSYCFKGVYKLANNICGCKLCEECYSDSITKNKMVCYICQNFVDNIDQQTYLKMFYPEVLKECCVCLGSFERLESTFCACEICSKCYQTSMDNKMICIACEGLIVDIDIDSYLACFPAQKEYIFEDVNPYQAEERKGYQTEERRHYQVEERRHYQVEERRHYQAEEQRHYQAEEQRHYQAEEQRHYQAEKKKIYEPKEQGKPAQKVIEERKIRVHKKKLQRKRKNTHMLKLDRINEEDEEYDNSPELKPRQLEIKNQENIKAKQADLEEEKKCNNCGSTCADFIPTFCTCKLCEACYNTSIESLKLICICCSSLIIDIEIDEYLKLNKPAVASEIACEICTSAYVRDDMITLDCDHFFCTECTSQYIKSKLEESNIDINCPLCQTAINTHTIQSLVVEKDWDLYVFLQMRKEIVLVDCPKCNNRYEAENPVVTCTCGYNFCTKCLAPPHEGTCDEAQINNLIEGLEAEGNTFSQCPECRIPCLKDDKCEHVVCGQCRTEFCFQCSCFRSPTLAHGNHYHRPQCRFFDDYNGPNEYTDKCSQCLKDGQLCEQPKDLEVPRKFGKNDL